MNRTSSGFLALLQDEDADGDAGRIEQVGRQADDGVDVPVVEELATDLRLHPATEQHAVRQDDGHHAVVLEIVKPVQQESEVCRRLRGKAVVLESYVPAPREPETDGLSRNPADCVKYGCIDNGGG